MKYISFFACLLLLHQLTIACTCIPKPTVEQGYKSAEAVVHGRIIKYDTVTRPYMITHDRKGVRVGGHRYLIEKQQMLRATMVVEKWFKQAEAQPDTVYVLTSLEGTACGFSFAFWSFQPSMPERYDQFIVYGDYYVEPSIERVKKGRRYHAQIKKTVLTNTIFTTRCSRTTQYKQGEADSLNKITGL